ncbi:MAG: alpha-amylase family glycosyl hydrolase, partial [Polyangiaceae bacterium]|nr:alpha-amylase family glycosyl hydrolase [Polyangiaceae bacterium]
MPNRFFFRRAGFALTAGLIAAACADADPSSAVADTEAGPELGTSVDAATQQDGASAAILFQGFHWNSWRSGTWYNQLASRADDLRDLGVTHVWFPPPSDSGAVEGYLPRRLNVLDSRYGNEAALRDAIGALGARGIASVADIVINHRVGNLNFADFSDPAWGCSSVVSNDEWPGRCGNGDSGDGFGAGRDIDHSQTFVQDSLRTWMNTRLKGVGFTGIRYDYSRGYSPAYARLYHDSWGPDFCVGETWTDLDYNNVDAHRQILVNWVNGTNGACASFDFTTKGLLNQALASGDYWRLRDSSGKPAGAIGWWPGKQVTFVDNHDTGPSESCGNGQNHWPVPCDKVMVGYAYVLSHPGVPTIYYPHVYDWNLRAPIKALVDARRAAGVRSTSVAVKIGPNDWSPGAGWALATSGGSYAVWTKLTGGTGGSGGTAGTGGTGGTGGTAGAGGAGGTGGTAGAGGTAGTGGGCSVNVSFRIANANTTFGQNLYVVGQPAALGAWSPAAGFQLAIQGTGANALWSGSVALPAGAAIQYKYVKYN